MKCLILAAGYATRLYPLTENFPKPLLEVAGKSILDWLVDDINGSGKVDGFIVVTNHKFARNFQHWAESRKDLRISVVDDGTLSNETRLGAVKDIRYAVDKLGIDDDMLVIAGDNVLDFSLQRFISYAVGKKASCIMRYYEAEEARLHRSGIVVVDADDRVLHMEEKPAEPKSRWCCPPFYFYTREDIRRIGEGLEAGCGTDAPGSFAAWLSTVAPVYAMQMPGQRYDIGNLESYRKVCSEYKGIL